MKISNKEKIMLCILGIILVGFGYYNFIYTPQVNAINQKTQQKQEVEEKYNNTMNTINAMEERKSDVKILKAKIADGTVPFYPVISEEHLIIELDKLLNNSGLKGGITFEPIVCDSVEKAEKENKNLAESSFQGIVDKYSLTEKEEKKDDDNKLSAGENSGTNNNANTENNNKSKNSSNNSNTNDNSNASKSSESKGKNTIQYLKCSVNFEGSYDDLYKFINTVGTNEKKIVVNSISIGQDTIDGISGTMNLEIYAIPKINDEVEDYLKWDFNNTYGKSVPFSKGAATGTIKSEKDDTDFIASVKSINSDLPTIMIGKANDSLRTTYAYADSNSKEDVEMVLTQDGDKYYYKYKTSKGTFPGNYSGLGAEFAPASKNIVVNILSESRVTPNDKSGIKLKIINKTDKLVNVNISGEDTSTPRVIVDGNSSNINVNQK